MTKQKQLTIEDILPVVSGGAGALLGFWLMDMLINSGKLPGYINPLEWGKNYANLIAPMKDDSRQIIFSAMDWPSIFTGQRLFGDKVEEHDNQTNRSMSEAERRKAQEREWQRQQEGG